ncbi:MAG: ATP-binding protein [Bacillota bacterium]
MPGLKLPAVIDNLEQMISFILQGLESLNIKDKEKHAAKLRLACEEALVNIIKHAYKTEKGDVEIIYTFDSRKNEFKVKLLDKGPAFNPLAKEDPDINLPVEERQIGGLGILMIKNSMDEVKYERKKGKNILIMTRYLNSSDVKESR